MKKPRPEVADANKEIAKAERRSALLVKVVEDIVYHYEAADEDNGGGGSMEWDDIDQVFYLAKKALGKDRVRELRMEARKNNGMDDPDDAYDPDPRKLRMKQVNLADVARGRRRR